jgi:hypothetical protein
MIGVETAQILQAVFLLRMVTNDDSSTFYALDSLKYSNGYNQIYEDEGRDYPIGKLYTRLGLSKDPLLSININLALVGLSLVALVICFIVKKCSIDDNPKDSLDAAKEAKLLVKLERFSTLTYERLLFPFTVFSMFLMFLSYATVVKSQSPRFYAYSPKSNFAYAILFLQMVVVCCYELFFKPSKKDTLGINREFGYYEKYISGYLLYQLLFVLSIVTLC